LLTVPLLCREMLQLLIAFARHSKTKVSLADDIVAAATHSAF
jgi:hypothetical protein